MLQIGDKIDFDIDHYTIINHLIWYDGPCLTLISNKKDKLFLFYWVDSDQQAHRYLISEISLDDLRAYVNLEITLYEILNKQKEYIFADYYGNTLINATYYKGELLVEHDNIEDSFNYLPEKDSYYFQ